MDPNLQPPNGNNVQSQPEQPQQYEQYPTATPLEQFPPPSSKATKKLIILVLLALFLIGSAVGAWFIVSNSSAKTDKQGIQEAINAYCQDLGKSYGITGMESGYIISDRYSEEELSDSPYLLRFKQVGDAASATVDCEDANGPNGISNDLLFVKQDGEWKYVDEVQNNAGSGFVCSIVEDNNVSKDLVSNCSSAAGMPTQDR